MREDVVLCVFCIRVLEYLKIRDGRRMSFVWVLVGIDVDIG
jgi:hypothetical protein